MENYSIFSQTQYLTISLVLVVFSTLLLCFLLSTNMKFFRSHNYHAVQKIHDQPVSRLGGLAIYITLGIATYFISNTILTNILLCSIPLFFIGLIEDLMHNVKPHTRMIAILISSLIFIFPLYQNAGLPQIEIPIIGIYLNNSIAFALFLIISIAGVSNGVNMIDGANGLSGFSVLTILIAISFIAFQKNDLDILIASFILMFGGIGFLLLNYPWGKIFLGDAGAYFLGFAVSILTICLYSRNDDLPSWGAILILFYPVMEVLFSFTRKKVVQKKTPFAPDTEHLHLKLFFVLNKSIKVNWIANSFVTPSLALIWLMPPLFSMITFESVQAIWIGILLSTLIYLGLYIALPKISIRAKK